MSFQEELLVFGASGMLGRDLVKELRAKNLSHRIAQRPNFSLDMDLAEVVGLIDRATVVVNCVAYTNVDLAESESDLAFRINHSWPKKLAEACKESGSHLVHISTDYVFAGDKNTPYLVSDITNPLSVYGKSKEAGEKVVLESESSHSIFRTAWLYGESGRCFPRTISNKLKEGKELSVVSNQFGSPTWTKDLAQLIIRHVELGYMPEIVHATSGGACSWYQFALEIAETLGYNSDSIKQISSSEYKTAAKRPHYSVLKCEESPTGIIGDWRERWREASYLFR